MPHPMQLILKPLSPSEGNSVVVETNPQATVATLISSFCSQKGIAYSSQLVIYDDKKRPLPSYTTLESLGITNGQSLLIGYKEKSFVLTKEWPLFIAIAALVIGLIGILSMSMVYGLVGGVYPYDHGVVMDAGSSKTNTIVYEWQANKYKGTGCVSQSDNCYAKGGIAKMDPLHLEPVINCAQKVTSHIAAADRARTPLYFAATAGMRLLNLTDPDRASKILDQLKIHLNETGLSVRAVEIISGRDEGIYAWISANFLKDTLETPQQFDPWVSTTYGALDMGGASMQISYALPENSSSPDVLGLKLYGQTHNVFSHSNLCFGRDEANRRFRLLFLKDLETDKIFDPCIPDGYVKNITGANLFGQPCTNSKMFPNIDKYLKKNYTFVGTSEYKYCRGNMSKLLDQQLCENWGFKECFKKLDNIPEDQKYLAFATYYYTTNFLNISKGSLEEYEKTVYDYCSKNYSEVQKISKSEYALEYCFNGQYIYEVLLNGFNFNNKTWSNLQFVGAIKDKDVGWTLGYMINATNLIPEKARTPKLVSPAVFAISLVIFIVLIIGTLLFLLHSYRKGNNGSSSTDKSFYGQP